MKQELEKNPNLTRGRKLDKTRLTAALKRARDQSQSTGFPVCDLPREKYAIPELHVILNIMKRLYDRYFDIAKLFDFEMVRLNFCHTTTEYSWLIYLEVKAEVKKF